MGFWLRAGTIIAAAHVVKSWINDARSSDQAEKTQNSAKSDPEDDEFDDYYQDSTNSKVVSMTCENCGASLNLDLDNLLKFCPYCGNKVLVDPKAFLGVLKEKEKTKRAQMKYDQERLEWEAEERNKPKKHAQAFVLSVIGVVMLLMGYFIGGATGDSNSPWYMVAMIGMLALFGAIFTLIGFNDDKKK